MDFKAEMNVKAAVYMAAFCDNDMDVLQDKRLIPNSKVTEWVLENVPLVDLPDKVMERAYYFRWWTFRKHIRKTKDGYVISEFLADVPWAGKHNTINCAAGHHFYEGRWIKNSEYLDQYLRFWFEGGGSVRSYSFWVADAAYRHYLLTGDLSPLKRHFSDFVNNYEAWEISNGDESGLFWQVDDREGMELSMGGTGIRPNINSYMYAEAKAIANISRLLGEEQKAQIFDEKAASLKTLIIAKLWDTDAGFFKTFVTEKHRQIQQERYQGDNAYLDQPLGLCPVPELFGYVPWYYGVMDNEPNADFFRAWNFIVDKDYFAGPAGLATAPIKHPDFMRPHHHECAWDGPSWPYATCQTLGAMARMLRNNYRAELPVTARDFMKLAARYAAAHYLTNEKAETIDWIDENFNPLSGTWIARNRLYEWNDVNKDRGQYYNHSTFCDLIISDVIGLQCEEGGLITIHPLVADWPYFRLEGVRIRGYNIAVVYNKDTGLIATVDGNPAAQSPELGRIEFKVT